MLLRRAPARLPAVLHCAFLTTASPSSLSTRSRWLHSQSVHAAPPPGPLRTVDAAAPAASDSSRLAGDSRAASIAFARWLSASGVRFNSTSDSRPLFGLKRLPSNPNEWFLSSASRVIEKGETILKLPRTLALAPSSPLPDAVAAAQLHAVMQAVPANLWPLKNGLRLTYEYAQMVSPPTRMTSSDSFYAPYIHLLPQAYPNIPLFWSPSQLEDLQYQPVQLQVKARSEYLRHLAPRLREMEDVFGKEAAKVTEPGRLGWAMSSVSSRAFQIRPGECANLPLIDMMNHSYANNCKVVFDPKNPEASIHVEAVSQIQPGTELTLNYGFHPNDSFLLNYGFLLDENPADTLQMVRNPAGLELAVEMSGEAKEEAQWQKELKAQVLGGGVAGGDSSASSIATANFTLTRDAIDPVLVAYVKMLTADSNSSDRTWNHFLSDTGAISPTADGGSSVSQATQVWQPVQQDLSKLAPPAARVLFSYLSLLQSSFPTTLQQDIDALQKLVEVMLTSEPDPRKAENVQRQELAIRFRIGKKRILAEQMRRLQPRM
jgi:hypothetical protein